MGEKGKKILKAILIHKKIIIITILIFIAFFILLIPAIIHMITLDDGSYDEGNNSNVPYVVSNDYLNNVKFNENGIYFEKEEKKKDEKTGEEKTVTTKVTYQDIWDDLTSKDSCLENYLFNAEELAKLMNAQVITQYPYLSTLDPGLSTEKGTLNGTVKFERHKTDGTTSMLEYVNYNSFQKMIEENNSAVLGKFTLDESNNLVIGVKDKTTETLTYNDPETKLSDYAETLTEEDKQGGNIYSRINETYTSRTINYQNAISQYVMPFQYLWSFLVISDCKDFVFELADLVEGSEIVISIFDNVTTTEVVAVDEYKRETRDNKYARLSVSPSGVISKKTERYWVPSDNSKYEGYNAIEATSGPYKVTHTSIYESNTPSFDVTTADVWIVDLKKVYESETKVETYTDVNKIEDKEFEKIGEENPGPLSDSNAVAFRNEYQQALQSTTGSNTSTSGNNKTNSSTTESSVSVSYVSIEHYARLKDRVKTTTTTTTTQNYVKKSNNIREKTDPTADEDSFVTIFLRPYFQNARSQILGILDWLFEMLENNPDTVNMVDLTKYLLYKATGNDYGVTEYDFSEYEDNTFSDTGGNLIYGSTIEEKVWFALKAKGFTNEQVAGAMGNLSYESVTFNPKAVEGGYNENTGGIGIAQWTDFPRGSGKGSNTELKKYAKSKGVTWQDEDTQVEFLVTQLTGSGPASKYTGLRLTNRVKIYGSSLAQKDAWKKAKTVEDATKAFCYTFEGPGRAYAESSMPERIKRAKEYYNQFKGMEAPVEVGGATGQMAEMLKEAQRIANDDRYLYDQSRRYQEFYYDCSSLVARLYKKYFNIITPNTTSAYGGKYRVGPATSVTLKPGDVLWRQGHVTIYIGNGKYVAAHGRDGSYARNPASQISVYNDSPAKYTYVYRFVNN